MSTLSESFSQHLNNAFSFPTLSKYNFFITLRGLALIGFALYLLSGPVSTQTDIIGAVIAISLIAFQLIAAFISLLTGRIIRKKFDFKIYPPEAAKEDRSEVLTDQDLVSSSSPTVIVIRTSALSIPPFFTLTLKIYLHTTDLQLHHFVMAGMSRKERILIQKIYFPHRGDWHIEDIEATVSDRLGLTSYSWNPNSDHIVKSFRIYPPSNYSTLPPVISSSSRAGDTVSDIRERHGDPYDLKPHHPADGMRKIAWKIFAKTGELIARHPEHTMTPEGQTLLFCVADNKDDDVCSTAIAYMKVLEERELDAFFSCEGNIGSEIARDVDSARELLVQTVWNTSSSTADSVRSEVATLINTFKGNFADSNLRKIVIFCSERRLMQNIGYDICKCIGELLASLNIEPVFCIVSNNCHNIQNQPLVYEQNKTTTWIKGLFFETDRPGLKYDYQLYKSFLNLCGANNWQIVI